MRRVRANFAIAKIKVIYFIRHMKGKGHRKLQSESIFNETSKHKSPVLMLKEKITLANMHFWACTEIRIGLTKSFLDNASKKSFIT